LPQEDIPIAAERGTAIYRILQEILTNVARHAAANRVEVQLTRRDHDIILLVHDNGSGIPADKLARQDSLGILGMQERALAVGGEIKICSSPGAGTTVRARIPAA
jgi:signal transduction histidine kinase